LTDLDVHSAVVPQELIEKTAAHVFQAVRMGGYANTAFGDLPAEHQEFWCSVVRMVLARALTGRLVVELPSPVDTDDGTWEKPRSEGFYWRCRADVDNDGGPVVYVVAPEEMTVAEARAFFSAGLAAAEFAERLADQDEATSDLQTEEVSDE